MPQSATMNRLEVEGAFVESPSQSRPMLVDRPARSILRNFSHESVVGTPIKVADLFVLTLAMIAVLLPFYFQQTVRDPAMFFAMRVSVKNLLVLGGCWCMWSAILHMVGVYEAARIESRRDLLLRLYTGVGGCSLVALLMLHFRSTDRSVILPLLIFFGGSLLLTGLARVCAVGYDGLVRPRFRKQRRAVIVGTDRRAEQLVAKLRSDRDHAYKVVCFVDPKPGTRETIGNVPVLGSLAQMQDLLLREHVDEVLVALPVRSFYEEIRQVLELCEACGVRSQYFSDLFPTRVTKRREPMGENSERVILHMVHTDARQSVKRGLDLVGAAVGLLVLSPLFLLIAVLIRVSSPGPVFFSQVRYGLNKRRFAMFKFRSMVADAEARQAGLEHLNETGGPVFKIKDDPRITRIGRFLRRTSLDELPQLWNVLLGEMSLVGPRPLPMRDVTNFSELSLVRRFSVKPGMTGLWQVSGRSNTSFDGWIKLDLYYIDHWSLLMDARILLRTFPAVLGGSGAL